MPYIKKIKIKGFKSFGSKNTTITLDKGFTVFTGPNGSGKTNIVDAILFGLGELSSRRLRSENLTQLVFKGSPNAVAKKSKFAEVVIQFDNSDHRIPINTSTVTISREIRENGQSVYQFNGKQVTRSRIVDMLSVAGISPNGHNVVMQGMVTRISEISPYERRKTIENLIGIAQYNAERAEAEEKLQKAEISIQTAMGRIEEVQKRVDDLERERNELLHFNFIQTEIKQFKAMKISHEFWGIERKIRDYSSNFTGLKEKVEKLSKIIEKFRSQRYEIESEWRKFNSEIVDEGGGRVLEVQIKIGDLKSKLAELKTKIDVGTTTLKGLKRSKGNILKQLETSQNEITKAQNRIRQLKKEYNKLSREVRNRESQHNTISQKITQTRTDLGENNAKIQDLVQQVNNLSQKFSDIRGNYVRGRATVSFLSNRLKDLRSRKNKFTSTINELEKSLIDLSEVKKEQTILIKDLKQTIDRRLVQKRAIEKEIKEAKNVAESAREAVVEFATQRELAEKVAAEEKALRMIEELGNMGAIKGMYGRLRNLIKIEKGYRRAIEAASVGWLDSIVVRDFKVALTCAETLKRLKLSRIKIISLRETVHIKPINNQEIDGIIGTASAFVKCAKRYEPAVNFVFGDTLTAEDDSVALTASREGYRTVTINGDLFEAGGGIESGYYRAPINFFSIIPSEPAVQSLDQAVEALQEHLARRKSDITIIEEEIDKTRGETVRLAGAITTLDNEIEGVRRNIKRTNNNIRLASRTIQRSIKQLDKEESQTGFYRTQRNTIQRKIGNLRKRLTILRQKIDPPQIQEMETQREKFGDEIMELRRRLGGIETELTTLQSKLKTVLKINSKNLKTQLKKVNHELPIVARKVEEDNQTNKNLKKDLLVLEKSKKDLSLSVLKAKEEAKKFTFRIDDIDKRLHGLNAEYEQNNKLLNQLQLNLQTYQLQLDQHRHQLKELDYEEPLKFSSIKLTTVESSLNLMQYELKRLGAVNQLALSQYDEQISRYKELSIRINELEREKKGILNFMDEIERKKRKVFMDAFNRINDSFSAYFSKLTGGGEAALKLGNVEDPFSGGMDMIVQFPTKPPIIVGGASGGERSVAAVAFIFALQDFMPAAFYLFDEVDAHLDAFHVEKLGELLAENSGKSQLLIISLKPELVSKADRVIGIYARDGVSHAVTTTFASIAAS